MEGLPISELLSFGPIGAGLWVLYSIATKLSGPLMQLAKELGAINAKLDLVVDKLGEK